jgi:hypothetical protein
LPDSSTPTSTQSTNDEAQVAGLPAEHPAGRAHRHAMSVLARDLIDDQSPICQVYESDAMTAFLAETLQEPVHCLADPLVSLVVTAMSDGDEQGWHFDGNAYVVSILLQKPEGGGVFEYVPKVRSEADPAYERVAGIFTGDTTMLRTAKVEAGTLALFRGQNTVHRVSPVVGTSERLMALLSYDRWRCSPTTGGPGPSCPPACRRTTPVELPNPRSRPEVASRRAPNQIGRRGDRSSVFAF